MITPDDDITIPEPVKEKSSIGQKFLVFFAIIGVIGLGTCGISMAGRGSDTFVSTGILLIAVSLVGLALTGLGMAIETFVKAAGTKDNRK